MRLRGLREKGQPAAALRLVGRKVRCTSLLGACRHVQISYNLLPSFIATGMLKIVSPTATKQLLRSSPVVQRARKVQHRLHNDGSAGELRIR